MNAPHFSREFSGWFVGKPIYVAKNIWRARVKGERLSWCYFYTESSLIRGKDHFFDASKSHEGPWTISFRGHYPCMLKVEMVEYRNHQSAEKKIIATILKIKKDGFSTDMDDPNG